MMKNIIYFISDAHIGHSDIDTEQIKEKHLISFFRYIQSSAERLYINGDFFDFWFEYHSVIPKVGFRILSELTRLAESGTEIHLLGGNHDYWFNDFLPSELGIHIHKQPFIHKLQGYKFYLHHGDGFMAGTNDIGYKFLKFILHNKLNIFLFGLIHPDIATKIAYWASHLSRKRKLGDYNINSPYTKYALKQLENSDYDILILAHTHTPLLIEINKKYYLNLGNWYEDFSYGMLKQGQLSLNYWKI